MARAFDIGITPWGVLGAGFLSGKYAGGKAPEDARRQGWVAGNLNDRNHAIAAEVIKIAGEIDRSPAQIAIAWIRQKGPNVIPILGARKHEQLVDNLKAADLKLSAEQMKRLDEVSAISHGFPHDFLSSAQARAVTYGPTLDLIDDHRR
jgi:aryl-alcohol dehydrogenase-like predicted oxidoreductase